MEWRTEINGKVGLQGLTNDTKGNSSRLRSAVPTNSERHRQWYVFGMTPLAQDRWQSAARFESETEKVHYLFPLISEDKYALLLDALSLQTSLEQSRDGDLPLDGAILAHRLADLRCQWNATASGYLTSEQREIAAEKFFGVQGPPPRTS